METRYLKTLLCAVETGSFSKAAEMLHITQSAVSQRIKFIEERYGHQLLDRSGPVLVPTEAGWVVIDKARVILDKESELQDALKRMQGQKRLALCCTPTYGMGYLPGVLNEFIRQNSDMADLKFLFHQPEQALKGLQHKEFDLAIIEHCGDIDFSAFHTLALPDDELVFVSAPALRIGAGEVELKSLLPQRLYARRDGCSSKELLRANLARLGKQIDDFSSVVISDDLRLTIQSVLSGSCVAYISTSLASEHLAAGTLCAHRVQGFEHFRQRTAVVQPGRSADPMILNFLECVTAAFAQSTGEACAV